MVIPVSQQPLVFPRLASLPAGIQAHLKNMRALVATLWLGMGLRFLLGDAFVNVSADAVVALAASLMLHEDDADQGPNACGGLACLKPTMLASVLNGTLGFLRVATVLLLCHMNGLNHDTDVSGHIPEKAHSVDGFGGELHSRMLGEQSSGFLAADGGVRGGGNHTMANPVHLHCGTAVYMLVGVLAVQSLIQLVLSNMCWKVWMSLQEMQLSQYDRVGDGGGRIPTALVEAAMVQQALEYSRVQALRRQNRQAPQTPEPGTGLNPSTHRFPEHGGRRLGDHLETGAGAPPPAVQPRGIEPSSDAQPFRLGEGRRLGGEDQSADDGGI
eukprot:TRINITY_DN16472_c0_g1_i1.p1 TRINITY_DN16472_c0_g1~~TRINITY_DN16472_c0_g1_i1.p1  ORF type:complete len:345 (+),score=53.56 TRINITY_DN16472_c0_g1_i1:54-1037(+)